jgi:hypothetical protein
MSQKESDNPIIIYLLWLGFVSLIFILFFSLKLENGFITPKYIYHCLLEAELFFILILWPCLLIRILEETVLEDKRAMKQIKLIFTHIILFFVLALPLVVICEGISRWGIDIALRMHLVVFTYALFVGSVLCLGLRYGIETIPWYYLFIFLSSAGVPFFYYIGLEFLEVDLSELSIISPFWCAIYIKDSHHWFWQVVIFGSLTILFFVASFRKKASDSY